MKKLIDSQSNSSLTHEMHNIYTYQFLYNFCMLIIKLFCLNDSSQIHIRIVGGKAPKKCLVFHSVCVIVMWYYINKLIQSILYFSSLLSLVAIATSSEGGPTTVSPIGANIVKNIHTNGTNFGTNMTNADAAGE